MKITKENSLLYYVPEIKSIVLSGLNISLDDIDSKYTKLYAEIFKSIVNNDTLDVWKRWQNNPNNPDYKEELKTLLYKERTKNLPGPAILISRIVYYKFIGELPLFIDQFTKEYRFYEFVLTNLVQVRSGDDEYEKFLNDAIINAFAIWSLLTEKLSFNGLKQQIIKSIEENKSSFKTLIKAKVFLKQLSEEEQEGAKLRKVTTQNKAQVQANINEFLKKLAENKNNFKQGYKEKFNEYLSSFGDEQEVINLANDTESEPEVIVRNRDPQDEVKQVVKEIEKKEIEEEDIEENIQPDFEEDEIEEDEDEELNEQEREDLLDEEGNVQISKEEAKKVKKFYIPNAEKSFLFDRYKQLATNEEDVVAFRVDNEFQLFENIIKGKENQQDELFERYNSLYEPITAFQFFLEFTIYFGSVVFDQKQFRESLAAQKYIPDVDIYYNDEQTKIPYNQRELPSLLSTFWRKFLSQEKLQDLWRDLQEYKNQYILLIEFQPVFERIKKNLKEEEIGFLEQRATDLEDGYRGFLLLSKLLNSSLDYKGGSSSNLFSITEDELAEKLSLSSLQPILELFNKKLSPVYIPSELEVLLSKAYESTQKNLKQDQVQKQVFNAEDFIISLNRRSKEIGKHYNVRLLGAQKEKLENVPISESEFKNKQFLDVFWSKVIDIDQNVNLDALLNVFPESGKNYSNLEKALKLIKSDTQFNEKEDDLKIPSINFAYLIPIGWRFEFVKQEVEFNQLQEKFVQQGGKIKDIEDDDDQGEEIPEAIKFAYGLERNEVILESNFQLAKDEIKIYIQDRYNGIKKEEEIEKLKAESNVSVAGFIRSDSFKAIKNDLKKSFDQANPSSEKPFQEILSKPFKINYNLNSKVDSIVLPVYERIVKVLLQAEIYRLKIIAEKAQSKTNSVALTLQCSTPEEEEKKEKFLKDLKTWYTEKYRYQSDKFLYDDIPVFTKLSKQKKPINPCSVIVNEPQAITNKNLIVSSPRQLELNKTKERISSPPKEPNRGKEVILTPPRSPNLRVLDPKETTIADSSKIVIQRDDDIQIINSSPETLTSLAEAEKSVIRVFESREQSILQSLVDLRKDMDELEEFSRLLKSSNLKDIVSRTRETKDQISDLMQSIRRIIDQ